MGVAILMLFMALVWIVVLDLTVAFPCERQSTRVTFGISERDLRITTRARIN